jgi:cytidylate kinase
MREGGDLEQLVAETAERDRRDRARYLKLYDIDIEEYSFADMVIDAERYNQHQVVEIIVGMARERVL